MSKYLTDSVHPVLSFVNKIGSKSSVVLFWFVKESLKVFILKSVTIILFLFFVLCRRSKEFISTTSIRSTKWTSLERWCTEGRETTSSATEVQKLSVLLLLFTFCCCWTAALVWLGALCSQWTMGPVFWTVCAGRPSCFKTKTVQIKVTLRVWSGSAQLWA